MAGVSGSHACGPVGVPTARFELLLANVRARQGRDIAASHRPLLVRVVGVFAVKRAILLRKTGGRELVAQWAILRACEVASPELNPG